VSNRANGLYSGIDTMKLPHVEQAITPQQKLTEYLLSPTHRTGRSKAVFFVAFGFTREAWGALADALRRHDVSEIEDTPFGTSYTVEGAMATPDGACGAGACRVVH
jgi:hypothetical protein